MSSTSKYVSLNDCGQDIIRVDANASSLDLTEEITRKVKQASAMLRLVAFFDPMKHSDQVPDDVIPGLVWYLTDTLNQINTMAELIDWKKSA